MADNCKVCETRRPRRFCPGVRGDICARCCGTEREVSIDCPLDCEYLIESRAFERMPELDPATIPNQDVRITDEFLGENQGLIVASGRMLFEAAARVPGVIDLDVREALEALIRTYRTRETGLLYDTRPQNPLAGGVQAGFEELLRRFREQRAQATGLHDIRDTQMLGVLVFLERLERQHNNGRRRGRAFLDFLRGWYPPPEAMEPQAVRPA